MGELALPEYGHGAERGFSDANLDIMDLSQKFGRWQARETSLSHCNPPVTVIIRAYNAAKYIADAVRSAIEQDYQGTVEVLVLYDEGSTDNTLEVLEEISQQPFPQGRAINVIRHTHMSPFRAFEKVGFRKAKGVYLKPLDYDNYLPKDYLSKVIHAMEVEQATFSFSNVLVINEDNKPLGFLDVKPPNPFSLIDLLKRQYIDINEITFKIDCAIRIIQTLSFISHRFYDPILDDWLFSLLALKLCKPLYITDAHVFYRIHSSNLIAGAEVDRNKYLFRSEVVLKTLLAFYTLVESGSVKVTRRELTALRRALLKRIIVHSRALSKTLKPTLTDYLTVISEVLGYKLRKL